MKNLTCFLLFSMAVLGYSQAPTVDPTTPPARNAVDVISIFSEAYSNISGANYNPNWNQTGFATASSVYEPTGPGGSGNVVLAYPDFNYQGIEFNNVLDISAMEFLHLDIWTVGVAPSIAIISSGAEIPHPIPNTAGSWQSIDIPVAGITGDLTAAIQVKFDGGNGSNAIYVDNLYFWKNPPAPGTDATISMLEVDGVPVPGFTPNSLSYPIALSGGTTTVPQITQATTADPAATAVITQATAIPGDATVFVTSQDSSTTKTYTLSFYIGAPHVDAPTPPVRNAVDVISIFSEAYNNITGANYNPNWNQSGYVSASSSFEPTGAGGSGNVVLAYPNFNYQGIEFNNVLDITAMEFLHLDIWTVDGVAPNLTLISSGAEIPHPIPNGDGAWQSVDIPVAGITGDLTAAIQIKFDGGNGSTNEIYVDNLYFWKTPPAAGTDATISALEIDGVPLPGFTPNSVSYHMALPGGTTTVPQITLATTADPAATAVITQATGIPGDATVFVTSQDSSTTNTYTVSFYIGAPHIDAPTPPARDEADVISIFSEAYNNISGANYNPNWNQSGFFTASSAFEPTGPGGTGNVVLAYPNFSYQGIEFNNVLNITQMDFLHLDIWTVDGVAPNLTLISSGTEIPHPIPNGDGGWQSVNIPVQGITPDLTSAIQIKFDGGNGTTTEIYVDNLYFYRGESVSIDDDDLMNLQVFPNPTRNSWNLSGSDRINEIQVFDLQGRQIMEQSVQATAATIDASALPSGVYFIQVTAGERTQSLKVIRE